MTFSPNWSVFILVDFPLLETPLFLEFFAKTLSCLFFSSPSLSFKEEFKRFSLIDSSTICLIPLKINLNKNQTTEYLLEKQGKFSTHIVLSATFNCFIDFREVEVAKLLEESIFGI